MANRTVLNSTTAGAITGDDYMDNIAGHIGTLYDNISLIPTTVTNSGNDYTLTLDPVLDDDVVNGMTFLLSPNANNTGAVQIRAASDKPYYDCVKATGEALDNNDFDSDTVYLIAFIGGEFRILSVAEAADTGAVLYREEYTSTSVWNKPSGLPDNAIAIIELWGGGGGGAPAASNARGGGGGGCYRSYRLLASNLGASETVSIGAGGAAGSAGGATSFGSHLIAYGGGSTVASPSVSQGGGGGGFFQTGPAGTNGGFDNGRGGDLMDSDGTSANNRTSIFGGAGGGGANQGTPASARSGGRSLYGGGGGGAYAAGDGNAAGGASAHGGSGGAGNAPGTVPGGGGGGGAAGASGAAIITIIA